MIYTLRRGVNGIHVPVRYETDSGLKRLLPAMPAGLALPQSETARRYASYSAVPLLSVATLLALALTNHSIPRVGPFGTTKPHANSEAVSSTSNSNTGGSGSAAAQPSGGSGANLQSASSGVTGAALPIAFSGGGANSLAPAPAPPPVPVGGGGSVGGVSSSVISIGATCGTTTCTVTGCTQPVVINQGQKTILGVNGTCVVVN